MLRAPSSPECLGTVRFRVGAAAHPPALLLLVVEEAF